MSHAWAAARRAGADDGALSMLVAGEHRQSSVQCAVVAYGAARASRRRLASGLSTPGIPVRGSIGRSEIGVELEIRADNDKPLSPLKSWRRNSPTNLHHQNNAEINASSAIDIHPEIKRMTSEKRRVTGVPA